MGQIKKKAIFLDRDGIIVKMYYHRKQGIIDSPLNISQVAFTPGIFEFLRLAKKLGYLLILISNQPGMGIKKISKKNFNEIKNFIIKTLQEHEITIDGQFYCMHHPYASIKKYKKECDCRKPKTSFFLEAEKDFDIDLEKSWMIGDGVGDIIAGNAAGCKTILVGNILEAEYLRIIEEKLGNIKPTYLVKSLDEIKKILSE